MQAKGIWKQDPEGWEWGVEKAPQWGTLDSLYRSPNIVRLIKSRRLRWAGHVAKMEEGRSAFKILTGKPTGNRPLGRPRRRWEDNIRMDLEEIRYHCGELSWFSSGSGLLESPCECGIETPGSISHGVSWFGVMNHLPPHPNSVKVSLKYSVYWSLVMISFAVATNIFVVKIHSTVCRIFMP